MTKIIVCLSLCLVAIAACRKAKDGGKSWNQGGNSSGSAASLNSGGLLIRITDTDNLY